MKSIAARYDGGRYANISSRPPRVPLGRVLADGSVAPSLVLLQRSGGHSEPNGGQPALDSAPWSWIVGLTPTLSARPLLIIKYFLSLFPRLVSKIWAISIR